MLEIKLINDLRQRRIDSLRRKISEKKDIERKNFFSRYQTFNNIRDFENTSFILDTFVREKPESMPLGHYLRCLKNINLFGYDMKKLREHINIVDMLTINKILNTTTSSNSPYSKAINEYYSQEEFLHPSYESLRSGIYFQQIPLINNTYEDTKRVNEIKKDVLQVLEASKDLTLESGSLMKEDYSDEPFFDLPLKFASACYNSRNSGNGYIAESTPEIFKDINQDRLIEAMDLFSTRYRNPYHGNTFTVTMEIDGKDFSFEHIDTKRDAVIFKIRDDKNNSAILKLYKLNEVKSDNLPAFSPFVLYGSLGLQREANLAGVSDVGEVYIANPVFISNNHEKDNYMGGWSISEDIENEDSKDGIKFEDWLEQEGLRLSREYREENNNYFDIFSILSPKEKAYYQNTLNSQIINSIYSRYLNFETTDEIIKALKKELIQKTSTAV